MTCNICGSTRHEATTGGCPGAGMGVVEYERAFYPSPPTGWLCPACHKGNAPDAKTCGHCAEREPLEAMGLTSNGDLWTSGKLSFSPVFYRRAGDMPRDWVV